MREERKATWGSLTLGPVITLILAIMLEALSGLGFAIAVSAFILTLPIVFSSLMGGWRSGAASAFISWLYFYYFLAADQRPAHSTESLFHTLTPILVLLAIALMTSVFKRRIERTAEKLEAARRFEPDELERVRKELGESQARLQAVVEGATDAIAIVDSEGRFLFVNRAMAERLGKTREGLTGLSAAEVLSKDVFEAYMERLRRVTGSGQSEHFIDARDGRWLENTMVPIPASNRGVNEVAVFSCDISERTHLEEQFLHSQKMEAIGRLAGGVAHDFNNLLTAILGYSELALAEIEPTSPVHKHIKEIEKSARRASALTSQLLAFSRKHIFQPRPVDLNVVVADIEKLLERVMGEDIDLVVNLDSGLGRTKADPRQIEQIILNLAVNARDAMPRGGTFRIETANVEVDESYANRHLDLRAGSYVAISISDTGDGIDNETLSHIFEPFFTTKEVGKGTGLGLSTVYGIVKQCGGHISVHSEPGRGTTFKLLLPRTEDRADDAHEDRPAAELLSGSETVLLVEDDQFVRKLARKILQAYGYTVLEAQDAAQAVSISEAHKGPIDLVLTDVVMPRMNGYEAVERIKGVRPSLKVIYMSGHTISAAAHYALLDPMPFLQKPFSPGSLLRKVRDTLDSAQVQPSAR
jgi:PAS domain S-box-containing protein